MTKLTVTELLVEKKITEPNTQYPIAIVSFPKPNTQYPIPNSNSQNPIAIVKKPIVLLLGISVTCLDRALFFVEVGVILLFFELVAHRRRTATDQSAQLTPLHSLKRTR
jgi:hypothetical protein